MPCEVWAPRSSPEAAQGAQHSGVACGQHSGGSWHQENWEAALPSFEQDSERHGQLGVWPEHGTRGGRWWPRRLAGLLMMGDLTGRPLFWQEDS